MDPTPPQGREERLTPRERQVLLLTCQDLSVAEIAFELGVTESTIRNTRHAIFRELGVSDALGAFRRVMQEPGLLHTGVARGGAHPIGCDCNAIFCTAMRLAAVGPNWQPKKATA